MNKLAVRDSNCISNFPDKIPKTSSATKHPRESAENKTSSHFVPPGELFWSSFRDGHLLELHLSLRLIFRLQEQVAIKCTQREDPPTSILLGGFLRLANSTPCKGLKSITAVETRKWLLGSWDFLLRFLAFQHFRVTAVDQLT